MHDLQLSVRGLQRGKAYGTLGSAQVIVETGGCANEKRCRYTGQVERLRQTVLKTILQTFDGDVGFLGVQDRGIVRRDLQFAHCS